MILLDSVTKRYPGDAEPALDDVSLHIEPNEFVFLVGKSGAGKSTLIKMLTKEEIPDTGKIIVGGIDLDYVKKRHIPGYRRRLGVVFQDFKLLPRRTVYENVAFALEIIGMSGKEIRKTVPKVLELVDLLPQANKFPGQLSGGQQQRVSIARSVARQPKILIADEPTGQLDKLTTQEIIDLLKKINDFGTTILVTTHNENIVNNLGKRVVTLKSGRIVNDQKNHGIYRLDETPVETMVSMSGRVLQAPGHAFKPNPAKMVVNAQRPAEPPVEKTPEEEVAEKLATEKVVTKKSAVRKSATKSATKSASQPLPRIKSKTMPRMVQRPVVKKRKAPIARSNVI